MLYFIPSWYHENEYRENEQVFYSRRMVTEFDDSVKQVQLFNRNHIMDYKIINLSYCPNFRHFLHRQSVYHAPYWSAFDAIQEVKSMSADTLSFHDLLWPENTEFVYTNFCVIAYLNSAKYAEIHFGEDGNMIEVNLFQKDVLVRKNIYDDRGFLSCTQLFQNNFRVYEQYLNENGTWKMNHFFEDDHIEINPENNHYLIHGKLYTLSSLSYPNMESILLEVLNKYLEIETTPSDIFCMAMHTLHHDLLEAAFKGRKNILSFYKERMDLFEDKELKSLILDANYIVVDSKYKIEPIKEYAGKDVPIIDITPFDTRVDFGISQQLSVQNILVPVDNIGKEKFSELVLCFADYFKKNEFARVHFFTRNAMYNREDQLLTLTREVLKNNGYDERMARKESNNKSEFDLDGEEEIKIRFYVDQCVDELSISKCIRLQRIMVDITQNPDLYLQISCISSGIPMILERETQYIHPGKNGFILEEKEKLQEYLAYYLDSLTNWNKALVYSYEIGQEYNTKRLIQKWKEVMKHVEQY